MSNFLSLMFFLVIHFTLIYIKHAYEYTSLFYGTDGIIYKSQSHIIQLSVNCSKKKRNTIGNVVKKTPAVKIIHILWYGSDRILTSSFFGVSPPKVVTNL